MTTDSVRVELVPHDRVWFADYRDLASRVRTALGTKVVVLEHVGSTAVVGLAAKPVIDMVLVVSDSADEPAYVPALSEQGFSLTLREPGWFEHRLLKPRDR